jgi:hypothetical protein
MVPAAAIIAALVARPIPLPEPLTRDLHAAAGTLGLTLQGLHASSERDRREESADIPVGGAGLTGDYCASRNSGRAARRASLRR